MITRCVPWLLAAIVLAAAPWVRGDAPTAGLASVGYKVKPADGNLWYRLYARGRPIAGVPMRRRCISFTFDDGPDAVLTERLLDILDAHTVRAAFFVVGARLEGTDAGTLANRATLLDAWHRGHLVGNHSFHHRVLDHMTDAELRFEIDHTASLIAAVIGESPVLFRAPYGAIDSRRARGAVLARGYTLVRWAIDPRDWDAHSAHEVLRNFRGRLDHQPDGGIVLLHDVHPHTVAAVPLILAEIAERNRALRARGEQPYEIVGLDEFYRAQHASVDAR